MAKLFFIFIYLIVFTSLANAKVATKHTSNHVLTHKTNIDKIDDVLIKRRRITNLEKELLNSKNATKVRIHDRTVVQRDIFQCNRNNYALMLKGRAPFGSDGKKVNLHHLKQQKDGQLVELTDTEHNNHSKVLHRYVKSESEITDRQNGFQSFKQKYWKSRAVGCKSRKM